MAYEAEGERVRHVERQGDGWPVGIDDEDKERLTAVVKRVLEAHPDGLSTMMVYEMAKRDPEGRKAFGKACVWSWLLCATERACRAVDDCMEVWVIRPNAY